MEFTKTLCMQDLASEIVKSVDEPGTAELMVTLCQRSENFVGEMHEVMGQSASLLEPSSIVQLVKHVEIKRALMKLSSNTMKILLEKARHVLASNNPVFVLAHTALKAIADVDCVILESDMEARIKLSVGIKNFLTNRSSFAPIENLDRGDILEIFPVKFQCVFQDCSQLQLSHYLMRLIAGNCASHAFERLCFEDKDVMKRQVSSTPSFSDPESRERFLIAAEGLKQIDINRWNKGELIKAMRVDPSFTSELAEDIEKSFTEEDLSQLLSGIGALLSNTIAGRAVDRLSDEMATCDLRGMLGPDDKDALCARVLEMKDFDITQMKQPEILQLLSSESLCAKLNVFNESEIKNLVRTLSWLMYSPFSTHISAEARDILTRCLSTSSPIEVEIFKACTTDRVIDKLMNVLGHITKRDIMKLQECTSVEEIMKALGNGFLTWAFTNILRDTSNQAKYCGALLKVLEQLHSLVGDVALEDVIRRVALCTSDRVSLKKIGEVLYGTSGRVILRHSLVNVAEKLMMVSVTRLKQMSLSDLQLIIPNHTDLLSDMRKQFGGREGIIKENEIKNFLLGLASHFSVSLPYCFFSHLCNSIRTFDLRGLFLDVSARYRFILLVAVMFPELKKKVKRVVDNHEDPLDRNRFDCPKGELLEILNRTPDMMKGGGDKKDYFEVVRVQLRLMSTRQLRKLFIVALEILENTDSGKVYMRYLDSTKWATGEMRVLECVHLLRTLGEVRGHEFKEIFLNFDAAKFCEQNSTERFNSLSTLIDDEDLLTFLLDFKQTEIEVVFAHLLIPCSMGAMANVQSWNRESVESKVGDAELGPETAILGTGEPEYDD